MRNLPLQILIPAPARLATLDSLLAMAVMAEQLTLVKLVDEDFPAAVQISPDFERLRRRIYVIKFQIGGTPAPGAFPTQVRTRVLPSLRYPFIVPATLLFGTHPAHQDDIPWA